MIVAHRCPGVTARQYRCTSCGCNVSPTTHVSDSEECHLARQERDESRNR